MAILGDINSQTDIGAGGGSSWPNNDHVRYVSPTGDNANDGKTPSTAKRNVYNAVTSLPIAGSTNNYAHAGTVYIAPGMYTETSVIPLNREISIIGTKPISGTGATWNNVGVEIINSSGQNYLFDYKPVGSDTSYTGFAHNLRLDGFRVKGGGIRIKSGGFNTQINNVYVMHAPEHGFYLDYVMVNMVMIDVGATGCTGSGIYSRIRHPGTNHSLLIMNYQADDNDQYALRIDNGAASRINTITVINLEAEAKSAGQAHQSSVDHKAVIAIDNHDGISAATNPCQLHVMGMQAQRAGAYDVSGAPAPDTALIRILNTAAGGAALTPNITLQHVKGDGYYNVIDDQINNVKYLGYGIAGGGAGEVAHGAAFLRYDGPNPSRVLMHLGGFAVYSKTTAGAPSHTTGVADDSICIAQDGIYRFGSGAWKKMTLTPGTVPAATTDIKDALTTWGLLQGTSASPLNLDGGKITCGTIDFSTPSTGWSVSNVTSDKTFDANSTSLDEVADVLGTLIDTLKTLGVIKA